MPTPLEDIPTKYALDPSRGVREILARFPALTEIRVSPGPHIGKYLCEIVTPVYSTGHGIGDNVPFRFWYDERKGNRAYLEELVRCARSWEMTHCVPEKPVPANPIAAALVEARARPDTSEPISPAEDAFVARVLARARK